MNAKVGFFGFRIARRVLTLFLVCAFVPISALAILSLQWVGELVAAQSRGSLADGTRAYGQAVYQRLLLADDLLESVAKAGDRDIPDLRRHTSLLTPRFKSVWLVSRAGDARPVFGDPPPVAVMKSYSTQAGLRLITRAAEHGDGKVFLAHEMVSSTSPQGRLVAELDSDYLWGEREDFPESTAYCVLSDIQVVLFCSRALPRSALAILAPRVSEKPAGDMMWRDGDITYLSVFWNLFTEAKYGVPKWTIVATIPEQDAELPLRDFRSIFTRVVAVAILAVVLLSLTQIRRIVIPLKRLLEGTRRLAAGDFRTRVDLVSNDEFGQLAVAFNAMTGRVGSQFDTLTALAEIDRAILSRTEIDNIIDFVMAYLGSLGVADCACITLLASSTHAAGRTYSRSYVSPRYEMTKRASELHSDAIAALLDTPDGRWMARGDIQRWGLAPQDLGPGEHFLIYPVVDQGRALALLIVACSAMDRITNEVRDSIRKMVGRLGVALASSAKDELLYRQAHFDSLTGLPNRLLFMDRIEQEISHGRRENRKLALLFIDLDRFKDINDTLGHGAGDEVLAEAGLRLRKCLRESDTVARLGGDEFTVLVSGVTAPHVASTVCENLIAVLSKPFDVSGQQRQLNASIGVAIYPDDGQSVADLLRKADMAMYRAKDTGRGRYVFFEDRMNQEILVRTTLERELRTAIERDEFVAYYQPQINLTSGVPDSAEALVRWQHPERGLLDPGTFIPVAEETGLVQAIDHLMLRKACRAFKTWQDRGLPIRTISVNVSAHRIDQVDLLQRTAAVLAEFGIEPGHLELEITESVQMRDMVAALPVLSKLRESGIRIAIDDFGTGYSSLSYLSRLPFDVLKVDRAFIRNVTTDAGAAAVTRSVITIAHSLGKSVIAEGVETAEHLAFLQEERCDKGQGYFFSRPLPPQQFVEFVAKFKFPHANAA